MAAQLILPAFSTYIKVEIDFTSNWNTTSPSYTDVTPDVRFSDGVSWQRGRDSAWDRMAAGSFQFTLNNRAGTYDPASNANMVGTRLCRITMYYPTTGTAYVQFVGVIDSWDINDPAYGKDQVVRAEGADAITSLWLTKAKTFAVGATSTTTSAVWYAAACKMANIPTAWQSFTAGTYSVLGASMGETDALSLLQNIANSQVHFLYVSKTGVITAIPVASASVSQTYTDTSSTYPYETLTGSVGGSGTYTSLLVSQSGTVKATIPAPPPPPPPGSFPPPPPPPPTSWGSNIPPGSVTNTTKYGAQVATFNCIPPADQTTGKAIATAWANVLPNPGNYWFKEITIKPLRAPSTLIPAVLGHELGDRITIVRHPLQGGSVTKSASIRTIRHDIKGGDWTVTFGLTYT